MLFGKSGISRHRAANSGDEEFDDSNEDVSKTNWRYKLLNSRAEKLVIIVVAHILSAFTKSPGDNTIG